MTFKIVRFDTALNELNIKLPRLFTNPLFKFLKLPEADELVYQAKKESPLIAENCGFALKYLNITYDFDLSQLQPYKDQINLITCNHPTGFLEVFIVIDILHRAGYNFRFLANDFINIIPDVNQLIVPVDVYSQDKHQRISSVRTIMSCFNKGLSLAAFPAGAVDRFNWRTFKIQEQPRNQGLIDMATRSKVNLINFHIKARNSWLFYLLAMLNPLLPTLLLFREYFKKKNKHFHVSLESITPSKNQK